MRCRRTAGRSGRWRCCGSSSTRWRCCSWVAGELAWVAGAVLVLEEGNRIPAYARVIDGTVDVDASMLTGESAPVTRMADVHDDASRPPESPVLVFSGT